MALVFGILFIMFVIALFTSFSAVIFYIYRFFVKVFVALGMMFFAGLFFLLIMGGCMQILHVGTEEINKNNPMGEPPKSKIATPEYAYGIPVPMRRGFIRSPFNDRGIIDVRGVPVNSYIKDPYSTNIIIVP